MEVSEFGKDGVRGWLHTPPEGNGNALVLTHGAGSNARAEMLVRVATAFTDAGWFVLRCDLPFRQKRASGSPFPAGAAEDRAGLRRAVDQLQDFSKARVFLGGHSYGGRQASMLAAEDPDCAGGLLLLSYPLHPPKKPTQLRTAHFEKLHTSALFVSGTADEFGSTGELQEAIALIPGRAVLESIEKARHDLKKGAFDLRKRVVEPFERLIG